MCNSGELILIGTEQIRSEGMFIYFVTVFFILLLGAILNNWSN